MEDSHILNGKDSLNSMIGPGTRFKGEFELDGLLRIDGDFSGIIRTEGKVLVGSNGRVECSMYAGRVVVGGVVRGDIISKEKVTILSTGMVIGNISTPRLIIEEGVIFNGKCRITRQEDEEIKESESRDQRYSEKTGNETREFGEMENDNTEKALNSDNHEQQPVENQYLESWRR